MSWQVGVLGQLCDVRDGTHDSPKYQTEGIPLVTSKNLINGCIDFTTANFITKQDHTNISKRSKVDNGDILFAMIGTVGNPVIVNTDVVFSIKNVGLIKFKEDSSIYNRYLIFALSSSFVKRQILRESKGGTQKFVSLKVLRNLKIPLPPLPVQKQIAAVLEKADTLRSQCQQMEQELNSLAQSVFLDMFGDPVTNPKGFELVPLGILSEIQIGPFGTMLHKSDYVSGGIPLINPTHIVKSLIVPSDDLTITLAKYSDLPQYHLKEGDVIMGRRGEMGRCAVVSDGAVGYFCGTESLFIRPDQKKIKSQYLNDLLSSVAMKRWFEGQSLGATMANLNKGIVSSVLVPLPPIDLQVRYEEVLKNISERLQNYSNLKGEIETNFNSLMQRAFKGELTLKDMA